MPIVSELSKVDVVVVGARIARLSAAYAAKKAGRSVFVLAAADRVGGRMMMRERNGDKCVAAISSRAAEMIEPVHSPSYPAFERDRMR